MNENRDLTRGRVEGRLARLGLPLVFGTGATLSVSLADAYFLGRLGTDELAAVSFAFPIVLTVTSLAIGLGAGAASVVSRAVGGDRGHEAARRIASDVLLLSLLIAVVAAALGSLTIGPVFDLLGAEDDVRELILGYMRVWYVALPLLMVPTVADGILRANGDAVAPSAILVATALFNVAIDPLFIFGIGPVPDLGVTGAAYATLAARIVGTTAALLVLIYREHLLSFALPPLPDLTASWGRVARVAVPAAAANTINPLAIALVTAFLATYGEDVVASFGVATRIESIAQIPLLALAGAIGPVAGQNWGAQKRDRVRRAMSSSYVFCVVWSVVAGLALFGFAGPLAASFSESEGVAAPAADYLRIVGGSIAGYGVIIAAAAAFNATDRALTGFVFTALRAGIFYVPLAWIGSLIGPPWAVFAGIAASNLLAGALVWWLSLKLTTPQRI